MPGPEKRHSTPSCCSYIGGAQSGTSEKSCKSTMYLPIHLVGVTPSSETSWLLTESDRGVLKSAASATIGAPLS